MVHGLHCTAIFRFKRRYSKDIDSIEWRHWRPEDTELKSYLNSPLLNLNMEIPMYIDIQSLSHIGNYQTHISHISKVKTMEHDHILLPYNFERE